MDHFTHTHPSINYTHDDDERRRRDTDDSAHKRDTRSCALFALRSTTTTTTRRVAGYTQQAWRNGSKTRFSCALRVCVCLCCAVRQLIWCVTFWWGGQVKGGGTKRSRKSMQMCTKTNLYYTHTHTHDNVHTQLIAQSARRQRRGHDTTTQIEPRDQ